MGQADVVDGEGDRAIWGLTGFLGCLLVSTEGAQKDVVGVGVCCGRMLSRSSSYAEAPLPSRNCSWIFRFECAVDGAGCGDACS